MRVRNFLIAAPAALAVAVPARAALVLEYIQVPAITSPAATGPVMGPIVMDPAGVLGPSQIFVQVALRDTLGSGPEFGQPGTVPWQTNGGLAGPGSVGLGAFFIRFDSIPGVAVNPSPTAPVNARLVNGIEYASVSAGTSPPTFTRFGGLINFGFEPGSVPDPFNQNRIPLFNLRIQALAGAGGAGAFSLRDPNPTGASVDNAILSNADIGGSPNAGTLSTIDDLVFGPNFTNVYASPQITVVPIPEPTSLALGGLALAGLGVRKLRRRKVA